MSVPRPKPVHGSFFHLHRPALALALCVTVNALAAADQRPLKLHAIFSSNMVLQRDKPIAIWGWAEPGTKVSVQLGGDKTEAMAGDGKGRWEATFPAREASGEPQTLAVTAGDQKLELTNVVVGDVWVMTGQSNMAFPLGKVQEADIESAQANLPLLRLFAIDPNEQSELHDAIPAEKIPTQGWAVSTPETAREFSAIGFVFGARLQRSLGVPIGVIKTAGGAAFIREAQRLGLADVGDPVNTTFLPADDVQVPGLHPSKKREHGERAARWALARIYKQAGMAWEGATLVSAEPEGDLMVLKFDKGVMPDDWSPIVEGFSIAGEDGRFYMAHARFPLQPGKKPGSNARACDTTTIRVWSPLVPSPKAVRYAWATSPMGNLKVAGRPSLPLHSFRTDDWDYPESDDPAAPIDGASDKQMATEATERLEHRRAEEAKRAVEILDRLKTLGAADAT